MNRSFMEVLDPQSFESQFKAMDKEIDELDFHINGLLAMRQSEPTAIPDLPMRPDYADVIAMDNLSIEEINDSVLEAEIMGGLPRMVYPLPLEPR